MPAYSAAVSGVYRREWSALKIGYAAPRKMYSPGSCGPRNSALAFAATICGQLMLALYCEWLKAAS